MGPDLAFALELADLADALSLPRFRAPDLRVDTKPDLTPVTDADRTVERALRERIAARRPGESVLGEEEGDDGRDTRGGVRWILDPIDGTKNFARGIPVWATQIALERDGSAEVGVVSAPALGRRWWATRGGGAFANGERIGVSAIGRLAEATVSGSPELESHAWHARDFGDFWHHMLVAEGSLEAAVDPVVATWDIVPDAIIVEEAGGRCSGIDGGPAVNSLVSTNRLVHDEALTLLADRDG
jgi:histidinol-phosphatase